MSILGRIAARASAATAGSVRSSPAASESTPAMASGSPLVRFDQRLTLPRFSEFGISAAADASAGGLDEADGLAAPGGGTTTATASPGGATSALAERPVLSEGTPAHAIPIAPMAERSSTPPRPSLEPMTPTARSVAPALATLVASQAPAFGAADVLPGSRAPEWSGDSSAQLATEVAVGKPEVPAGNTAAGNPPAGNTAAGNTAAGNAPASNAPLEPAPNRSVLDTITRLNAWMRTEGREVEGGAVEASPGRASTALPAPGIAAAFPEAPARDADDSGFSGAPMISIGRLEIEVVPPVPRERRPLTQPAPPRRQASAPRTALSAASGERRSFGWRQR